VALKRNKLALFALILFSGLGLVSAAHANAATINVNPATGKDGNSGSAQKPLKTLTAALIKARSGDTINLAGGDYSQATGERFSTVNGQPTTTVPPGVTIKGNAGGGSATILRGAQNQIGLLLRGNTKISEVTTTGFGLGLEASQGTQTLSGMQFVGGGIRLFGTAKATLTGQVHLEPSFRVDRGQTIFSHPTGAAISVNDHADFTMNGGDLFGEGSNGTGVPNCDTSQKGIFVSGAAHVALNSVLLDDLAGGALDAIGSSTADFNGSRVIAQYDSASCAPLPALRTLDFAILRVKNSHLESNLRGATTASDGIRALSAAVLKVTGSRIESFSGHGIVAGPRATSIEVSSTQLQSNVTQFDASAMSQASFILLHSDVIDNSDLGVIAPTLVMRNTEVTRTLTAAVTITGTHADLGTASSPGLNLFTPSSNTAVKFDPSVESGTIDAFGDVWVGGEQGANQFGIYPNAITIKGDKGPVNGLNFTLTRFAQSINLGPPSLGRLDLTPKTINAHAGGTAQLELGWTHPKSWKSLRSIRLRVLSGRATVGTITVRPLARSIRAEGVVRLVKSQLIRQDRSVSARLALRLPRSLAGRTLRLEVQAADREGHTQLERRAGAIRVAR
jgi:hypothetical protein